MGPGGPLLSFLYVMLCYVMLLLFSLSDRHHFTSATMATRKSTRARQTGAKTVPRKKAKKIEYPCGFCQQSWAADTILCSGCMTVVDGS